jgi:gliding motility-associated-like protein
LSDGVLKTENKIGYITVNPPLGSVIFDMTTCPTSVCQEDKDPNKDTIYTASSLNSTGITYSVSPVTAGVINPTTGAMKWSSTFADTAWIIAKATGLCKSVIDSIKVTVHPKIGAVTITGKDTVCQNAPNETYIASVLNSTGIIYSISPIGAGNISTSGVVDWDAAFSGKATITALATGSCGSSTDIYEVWVEPTTFVKVTGNSVLCQGGSAQYSATSNGNITYKLSPGGAGSISSTGLLTLDLNYVGTAKVYAYATSNYPSCSSAVDSVPVTVNGAVGKIIFTNTTAYRCQSAGKESYAATATNSTNINYTISDITAGTFNNSTGEIDWNASFVGVVTFKAFATGLCGNRTDSMKVTVKPTTHKPVFVKGRKIVCISSSAKDKYLAKTDTTMVNDTTLIEYDITPTIAYSSFDKITGDVTWSSTYSGPATVTARVVGKSCGNPSDTLSVLVRPKISVSMDKPNGSDNPISVCQNTNNVHFTATALNHTKLTFKMNPISAGGIDDNGNAWFNNTTGNVVITAIALNDCDTIESNAHVVTVNPNSAIIKITSKIDSICQGTTAKSNYTATINTSDAIVWDISPNTAGTINSSTGEVAWYATFSGTAHVTAKAILNCGLASDVYKTVVVAQPAPITLDNAPTELCQRATTIQLNATPDPKTKRFSYLSVSPSNAGSVTNAGLLTIDKDFSGTITVRVEAEGYLAGCSKEVLDHSIYIIPKVQKPTWKSGALVRCQGIGSELYQVDALNAIVYEFALDPSSLSAGSMSVNGQMDWNNPNFSGKVTIIATAYSKNRCSSDTCHIHVVVNPTTPKPVFATYAATICQASGTMKYKASSNTKNEAVTYTVHPSTAGKLSIANNELTLAWDANFSDTATIIASVNTPEKCGFGIDSIKVYVQPNVGQVTFSKAIGRRCQGATVDTIVANAPAKSNISYAVTPISAGTMNSTTGVMSWNSKFNGKATIRATASGPCGTSTFRDTTVTVDPNTIAPNFISGSNSMCQGAEQQYYFAITTNRLPITYSMTPSNAGKIDPVSGIADFDPAFRDTAQVIATAKGKCSDASSKLAVIITPLPHKLTKDSVRQPDCYVNTGKVYLSNLPASGGWVIRKLPGNDIYTGKGTTAVFAGIAPGQYTFTVTNSRGCVSPLSDSIVIEPQPSDYKKATGDSLQSFCAKDKPTIKSLLVTNATSMDTIRWYTALSGGKPINDSTRLMDGKTYYATLKSGVCESAERLVVKVIVQELPKISKQPIDNQKAYVNEGAFSPLVVEHTSLPAIVTYQWYKNTTSSYVGAQRIYGAVDSSYVPGVKDVGVGYYYCEVHYSTPICSDSEKSIIVKAEVMAHPIVITTLKKLDVTCYGQMNGAISVKVSAGAPFYKAPFYRMSWKAPNGFVSTADSIQDLVPGVYSLYVTDSIGMVAYTSYVISQPDELQFSNYSVKQFSPMSNDDAAINIEVVGGTLPYTYSWIFNGLALTNTPNLSKLRAGVYTVTVDDANGCGPIEKTFTIEESLYDNAFTPNGDNKNDVFLPGYELKIFNRNGIILYEGEEGWDGKYKGTLVEPGSYIFQVRVKSDQEVEFKSGAVTVVR